MSKPIRFVFTLGLSLMLMLATSARFADTGIAFGVGASQAEARPTSQCQSGNEGTWVYVANEGMWECQCTGLTCKWVLIGTDPIIFVNGTGFRVGIAYCEAMGQVTSVDYRVSVNRDADISVYELPSTFPENVILESNNGPANRVKLTVTVYGDGQFDAVIGVTSHAIDGIHQYYTAHANEPRTIVLWLNN